MAEKGSGDRPVALAGRLSRGPVVVRHLDASGGPLASTVHVQLHEPERLRGVFHRPVMQNDEEVLVENRLLLVRDQSEQLVGPVELVILQLVAELLVPVA